MPSPEFAPPLKGGSLQQDQPSCGRGERFTAPARHSVGVVFKVTQHLSLIRVPVAMVMVYYCQADKMTNSRILSFSFSLSLSSKDFLLSFSSHLSNIIDLLLQSMMRCSQTGTPVGSPEIIFGIFFPFHSMQRLCQTNSDSHFISHTYQLSEQINYLPWALLFIWSKR